MFRELRPEFFRVLTGANAAIYLDILDALERETSHGSEGLSREAALGVIGDILSRHPDFQWDTPTPSEGMNRDSVPIREKSRFVLDYLARCGWVEAETGANWHREVHFDAHAASVLSALRGIAHPDRTVFTDKLVGVCGALANRGEMTRQPWEHLQSCRENTRQGLLELRSMRKGVERLIRLQTESRDLAQNLALVFDHYAETIGHACYAELVRSQLPSRLADARENLEALAADQEILTRMQAEVLRRNPEMAPGAAMATVRNQVSHLAECIDRVVPLADSIDSRTAEFTRRSLARFRYLQEVVGERRTQVQAVFARTNRQMGRRRFSDLDGLGDLPALLLPDARLLAGRDSLYEPPRPRVVEDNAPLDDEPAESLRERTRRQMESALRDSLTVSRANAWVAQLPGGKGTRISSADFPLRTEDDIADLMALLLHAESAEARYRIETPRATEDSDVILLDPRAACRIERFFVIKK